MNSDPTNRNSRPSSTAVLEVKSNKTDSINTVSKQVNRNGKKRESGNAQWNAFGAGSSMLGPASCGPKNQKLWQPKPRGLDKRQKGQQGRAAQYDGGNGAQRKNDYEVMNSTDPDLDLLIPDSGRKQNLAHLLNMKFQLTPRDCGTPYWRATHSDGSGGKSRRYYGYHVGRSHYNKDSYLQANCQFVVKADGDYSVYLADPDLLVQWESIEQIRIWGPEVGACPICLHPPVAARMSRCGHIYCWPCVLHFLALSDKPSRPCPICDAPIKMQDLKSVVALEHRQLKVGEMMEMRLMKRERHSLQPQPAHRSQSSSIVPQLPLLQEAGGNHVYSKLLLATPRDVVDLILSLEKKDLLDQWEKEKDCPESCFIQQALELLAIRESSAVSEPEVLDGAVCDAKSEALGGGIGSVVAVDSGTDEALSMDTEVLDVIADLDSISVSDCSRSRFTSMSSEGHFDHLLSDDLERASVSPPVRCNYPAAQQQKNVFYFYQSNEGQAMYLHPLNVQMLVHRYGSLEHCPEVIQGLVVEKEPMSMTEELRNRMRYLGHLPVTSQFEIVEIALEEPIVDQETIHEFRERIDERERRRRRKDREERRRDIEIQRAEEAKWGRTKSQPIVRLDSEIHFPGFSPTSADWDPPLPSQEDMSSPPSGEEILAHGTEPSPNAASGPSFAQMLRQGKSTPSAWPTISAATKQPVEGAWNRHSAARIQTDNDNLDDLDCAPAPEFRETFSSALSAAFDKAAKSIDGSSSTVAETGDNRPGRKGKKKAKQKVLFATGMKFM